MPLQDALNSPFTNAGHLCCWMMQHKSFSSDFFCCVLLIRGGDSLNVSIG
jgi:hypothetical protein